ncbi:MAG: DNA topoisomerase-3 [Alteromonadaceae bacterium]|jgi:DNA topoisomerase-3
MTILRCELAIITIAIILYINSTPICIMPMKLYIAEKPSLGKAIADVLPKPHKREEGFIRLGNGDMVSWCIGHLLEQADPEAYDPAFKKWQLETLPIIPEQWILKPKTQTRKQLTVLKKLIGQATELVHAGDPDREGQLLVDQVIDHCGAKGAKKSGVKRLLISDLNPAAVKRALANLKDNREFIPLSTSALARSRADWLYGINLTRAYTVQGKKVGYEGLLSVGRVQTPLLGLVVRRDLEIENFVTKPFYEVFADVVTANHQRFSAKWKPSEACRPYMDEEGRVLVKALAENVATRITNQPAKVTLCDKSLKKQPAPLTYNLSALQIDAAKRFGMNAQQVLDICQSLYEKHKLITYPRSESRHLPVEHFNEADSVIAAIGNNSEELQSFAPQANSSLKGKVWNDSKVTAHHAIIPTTKKSDTSRLGQPERQVYDLIARQYLAQFFPFHEYNDTKVELLIAGGVFKAASKQTVAQGWKVMYPSNDKKGPISELPLMHNGDVLHCEKGEVIDKMTQPPAHFTDATLLAAMTGIARYVKDPEIRKILNDTDGLGTEATRAGIIELLFRRSFLQRRGKTITATDAGRGLIQSLPEIATQPDLTAQWESVLGQISHKQTSYTTFMTSMTGTLNALVDTAKEELPLHLKGVVAPARKGFGKGAKSGAYKGKGKRPASRPKAA